MKKIDLVIEVIIPHDEWKKWDDRFNDVETMKNDLACDIAGAIERLGIKWAVINVKTVEP